MLKSTIINFANMESLFGWLTMIGNNKTKQKIAKINRYRKIHVLGSLVFKNIKAQYC